MDKGLESYNTLLQITVLLLHSSSPIFTNPCPGQDQSWRRRLHVHNELFLQRCLSEHIGRKILAKSESITVVLLGTALRKCLAVVRQRPLNNLSKRTVTVEFRVYLYDNRLRSSFSAQIAARWHSQALYDNERIVIAPAQRFHHLDRRPSRR